MQRRQYIALFQMFSVTFEVYAWKLLDLMTSDVVVFDDEVWIGLMKVVVSLV